MSTRRQFLKGMAVTPVALILPASVRRAAMAPELGMPYLPPITNEMLARAMSGRSTGKTWTAIVVADMRVAKGDVVAYCTADKTYTLRTHEDVDALMADLGFPEVGKRLVVGARELRG